MADIKQHFKATSGFDAGNEKIINVAMADKNTDTDGVSVGFFNEHNTIQQYKSNRGYDQYFAVVYDNRPYYAKEQIANPAGQFDPTKWQAFRVDPNWEFIGATAGDTPLKSGDFIAADYSNSDLSFRLPDAPLEGDTITVKDVSGKCGVFKIDVSSTKHEFMNNGKRFENKFMITTPNSITYFIFVRNRWQVHVLGTEPRGVFVSAGDGEHQCYNGDHIYRLSAQGQITLVMPKYANNGDVVHTSDLDGLTPSNHVTIKVHPESKDFVERQGQKELVGKRGGHGTFIYDAQTKIWKLWDGDQHTRLQPVTDDMHLKPNTYIGVGGDPAIGTRPLITLTLPKNVEIGDRIQVSMMYLFKGQTCKIVAPDQDVKIMITKNLVQFPKRGEYPLVDGWESVSELEFNADTDYVPYIEFSYVENPQDGSLVWLVCHAHPIVERVDFNHRDRLGVIALATQEEANANHEDSPVKDKAITPETLANRTATETRRGVARIATQAEVHQHTGSDFDDDTIVTPKKLNACVASEEHRGVAEIATQHETNEGLDDTRMITPKKLDARRASEDLAGIAALVALGGRAPAQRDQAGTGVYDHNDHAKIVTPANLKEFKATENVHGTLMLATTEEVNGADIHTPQQPMAVTPSTLAKRTATEERHGLAEIATQVETNQGNDDTRIVTPKKLHNRRATETMHGLAEIATQPEFDAGSDDARIVTALKVKTFFSRDQRMTVSEEQGLVRTGNAWDGLNLTIKDTTEEQKGVAKVATQDLANAGEDDTTIITPKKLHGKKATETTEGIVKIANRAETVAGTSDNTAVSPKNLKYVVQTEETWKATETRRGFLKVSTKENCFVGNDTDGSTQAVDEYQHDGIAVTPRGLTYALQNYLPKMATAQNSLKLGGVVASNWVRRDIDQNIKGNITIDKKLTVGQAATFANSVTAETILVNGHNDAKPDLGQLVLGARGTAGHTAITLFGGTVDTENPWSILAGGTGAEDVAEDDGLSFAQINPDGENVRAFEIRRDGDTYTTRDAHINRNLYVTNGLFVGDAQHFAMHYNGDVLDIGHGKVNLVAGAGLLTTQIGDRKYQIIHQGNADQLLADGFVATTGGTMTGKLIMNNVGIHSFKNETAATTAPDAANAGMWNMRVTTKSVYDTYPEKRSGSLIQWGTDENALTQIWTPDGGHKHYIRTGSNNIWGAWGEIYTKQNKPTAQEIGAMVADGGLTNSMTVRDWIKIGNVKIVANPQTRTVEFFWEE